LQGVSSEASFRNEVNYYFRTNFNDSIPLVVLLSFFFFEEKSFFFQKMKRTRVRPCVQNVLLCVRAYAIWWFAVRRAPVLRCIATTHRRTTIASFASLRWQSILNKKD
jgi:hypothetical protein